LIKEIDDFKRRVETFNRENDELKRRLKETEGRFGKVNTDKDDLERQVRDGQNKLR
jgi:chromosome segregation ATPase